MSAVVSSPAGQTIVPAGLAVPWASRGPGTISRLVHGAYHLPGHPVEDWMADLAEACARVPGAIIGLGSAAYFELLVDVPPAVPCLIVDETEAAPLSGWTSCRIVRGESGAALHAGVIHDIVCGVPLRRTSAARTLVDFVRCRRTMADEVVVTEAARRFLGMDGDPEEAIDIARQLGAPAPTIGRLRDLACLLGRADA